MEQMHYWVLTKDGCWGMEQPLLGTDSLGDGTNALLDFDKRLLLGMEQMHYWVLTKDHY